MFEDHRSSPKIKQPDKSLCRGHFNFLCPVSQQSDNDVLKFESLVLLHDMVSQVTSYYFT